MLNEVKSADIKRRLIEAISKGGDLGKRIGFEIARREDTIEGLERHITKEREEIEYLSSLDPLKLEQEGKKNGGK